MQVLLKSRFFWIGLVWLAVSSAGCPGEEGPEPEPAPEGVVWEEAFDTTGAGSMSGVWGSAPDDVFVVGGDEARGVVFHFDGAAWTPMEIPEVPLLVWVFGFGPSDVYAVGVGGGAIHYDGEAWSRLETGTETDLWGVFGFAPDDIWVVGGDVFEGEPVLLHFDGQGFEPVALAPEQNPQGVSAIFKVFGIDGRLFAVGQRGLILELVGGQWTRQGAGAEANEDFVSLWGTSQDNIVAVGGRSNARIARFDGQTWRTLAPSGLGGLNAVFMTKEDEAVIGGVFGFGGVFALGDEVVTSEDTTAALDLHAIWGDGAGRFYAVGGNFRPPFKGVALVRRPGP